MLIIQQFNAFLDALSKHDWFYDYSDDHNVWRAGRASIQKIDAEAKLHPAFGSVYAAYQTAAFDSSTSYAARINTRSNAVDEARKSLEKYIQANSITA